jgi:signal transduction histidine kinase
MPVSSKTEERSLERPLIFRVKPRLFTLLGDQLIRDASIAVFELVKNAYDADATTCTVTLEHLEDPSRARIIVQDDGSGMDEDIFENVWMVIATDYRAIQRAHETRTQLFHRLPLGEKGLGRLSVHKLGHRTRLVTRKKRGAELLVQFDWDKLEAAEDLDAASVSITEREPRRFRGNQHGTRLVVTKLRESWSRGALRHLHRAVNSLCSPFRGPTDFKVSLSAPQNEEWLKSLFTARQARQCALYHVRGWFEGAEATYDYKFTPPPGHERQLSQREKKGSKLKLESRSGRTSSPLDLSEFKIGKVRFEFLLFDRDPAVLRAVTDDLKGLKDYLDENGGIRIYRDGIRVYDFGEPGNDWLNLDLRRVNTPSARTSNNQVLGALQLTSNDSGDLREKTNREGFIENSAFAAFREAVICILTSIEAEKTKDQKRVREALGRGTGKKVFEKMGELREILERKGVLEEVEPRLKAVEKEMELYRDQLLHAAVPGLTIGVMLHGAEKILDELRAATARGADSERISALVDRLYRAMRPVTNLLKNPHPAKTTAKALIKEAIFSTELRLKRHRIRLIDATESPKFRDFSVRGSKQMLVASVTNLIDNSIHWLESKDPKEKILYVGISRDLDDGPAIIVADNGPGFGDDDPDDLVTPFFTRRTGGMGLGLYIVNEVMRVNKGRLVFPAEGDVELPDKLDGAVVALQFPEAR